MSKSSDRPRVLIIGSGFSGLNCALELAKHGIKSEIYTKGYGASNLWVGTLDFLKYPFESYAQVSSVLKSHSEVHPYHEMSPTNLQKGLESFLVSFPEFTSFSTELKNDQVLTSLGCEKPCIARWNTIFGEFQHLKPNEENLIINFQEFAGSSMHLVQKGLAARYPGNYTVCNISIAELFQDFENNIQKQIESNRLSPLTLASSFDKIIPDLAKFSQKFYELLEKSSEIIFRKDLSFKRLFLPPVIGIEHTQAILTEISNRTNTAIFELVALSPSVMASRLQKAFEKHLNSHDIVISSGETLTSVIKKENMMRYQLEFKSRAGSHVETADYVILALGTVFLENFDKGLLVDENITLHPFEISPSLFAIGPYLFTQGYGSSDEDEIEHGTGLGLSIVTAYEVATEIIGKITKKK